MKKVDINGLREGGSKSRNKMCRVQKGLNTVAGIILLEFNILCYVAYAAGAFFLVSKLVEKITP